MTYTLNIPLATTYFDEDQPLILGNFAAINTDFGNDHYAFTELSNQGKHKQTTFVHQTTPVITGNDMAIYNKLVGAVPELFVKGQSLTGNILTIDISADPLVTITCTAPHELVTGQSVQLTSITETVGVGEVALNNSIHVINVPTPGSAVFTITQAAPATWTAGGVWTLMDHDYQLTGSGRVTYTTSSATAGECPLTGGFAIKFGTLLAVPPRVNTTYRYDDYGLKPFDNATLATFFGRSSDSAGVFAVWGNPIDKYSFNVWNNTSSGGFIAANVCWVAIGS